METSRPFLRPVEVASLLGVTASRVYQLIGAGELPATRVGGRLHIPVEAWTRWVQEKNDHALASMAGGNSGPMKGQGRTPDAKASLTTP